MTLPQHVKEIPQHRVGILASVLLWCLLWGSVSPLTLVGGLLIAVLVHVVFPLPPVGRELTFRPIHGLVFLAVFVKDLVVSSAQVSWFALRPSGSPGSGVIAVQMRSRSDLFLTFTGILATLIPGSVVVEAQRSSVTLFFHVIGAINEDRADAMRASILAQEARLLRAFAVRTILDDADVPLRKKGTR